MQLNLLLPKCKHLALAVLIFAGQGSRVGTTAADVYSSSVAAVPEPSLGLLFGLGLAGIVVMRYRAQATT